MLTKDEVEILKKSAREWQKGKTGWIPYQGMELPLKSNLVNQVTSLYNNGFVEIDTVWGAGWYRTKIEALIDIICALGE